MWLDRSTYQPAPHVAFGVAEGECVMLLGTRFQMHDTMHSHKVSLFRDGGSLSTMTGVPTKPGENTTVFFAVLGDDILTKAMKQNDKKFMRLTLPQVKHLFKHDKSAFKTICPYYARLAAISVVKKMASRRKQT